MADGVLVTGSQPHGCVAGHEAGLLGVVQHAVHIVLLIVHFAVQADKAGVRVLGLQGVDSVGGHEADTDDHVIAGVQGVGGIRCVEKINASPAAEGGNSCHDVPDQGAAAGFALVPDHSDAADHRQIRYVIESALIHLNALGDHQNAGKAFTVREGFFLNDLKPSGQ